MFDVSDSLAIAAACAVRGDIFGQEVWLDTAVEKMTLHGATVPPIIQASELRDLAV
jgi:hypothetical protein